MSSKISESTELYDEYNKITKIIQNIRDKLNNYTIDVEEYLKNTKDSKDKNNKIREYDQTLKSIKEDKNIFERYHQLIKRQNELRNILKLENPNINIKLLNDKYKDKNIQINTFNIYDETEISDIDLQIKRSIQNIKIDILLNKIKNFK